MIRRPPRSTRVRSSAASDVYKRQSLDFRVVSEALFVYDDAERTTASLKEKNVKVGSTSKTRYRVGGYFSAAQADAFGAFRRVARGAPCVKHGFPHSDEEKGA